CGWCGCASSISTATRRRSGARRRAPPATWPAWPRSGWACCGSASTASGAACTTTWPAPTWSTRSDDHMTSRLSSLLVRDGVIGVKRMEKAFQRQVLFGGALDTILLEIKEISEQRLVQYLSLATGLPPATARELDATDPRAIEVCPREAAEQFQVVPLSFEGDALRVLARDPVDLGALEDLASELGVPVQPFVAPEFRFELAFDRAYGRKSDARFTRIADMVKSEAPSTPVGRSQSVV